MSKAPIVTIHLTAMLRSYLAGKPNLALPAATVRAALDEIGRSNPDLYRNICDETGAVRRHINVFVNTSHVRELDGLSTRLRAGDVVTILPAVSGG